MLDQKKIYWRCRRGMLEVELFLLPFFEHQFASLSGQDQEAFVQLLDEADPDLLNWFMGYTQPQSDSLNNICQKIRNHAATNKINQ